MLNKTTPYTVDVRLGEALAEYEIAREQGQPLDRAAFLARHADLAAELAPLLDAVAPIENAVRPLRDAIEGKPLSAVPQLAGYEILGELGRGGMGIVYRARQLSLGRIVALKMILTGEYADENERTRFRAEAEALARMHHPNIVTVHDAGEHDGRPYFAMELVEGESLAAHLRRQPAGRLGNYDAARHLASVAAAVHEAHQRGILHRDLKPANILLDAAGLARVADFGLAKLERGTVTEASVRQEERLLGTLPYMSPEQTRAPDGVTAASDVYSLGAMLYELLTGRPPFEGRRIAEVLDAVRRQAPVPPSALNPDVSRRMEQICLRCLDKEPSRRYASAAELSAAVNGYLAERLTGFRLSAMGSLFITLGPVVILINLLVYTLIQGDFREWIVWPLLFSMYPALFATFLLAPQTRSDLESHSTRRELWSVWGAKLFTAITIAVVLRCSVPLPPREVIQLCYPVFAALSGMAVFIMTRDYRESIQLLSIGSWLVGLLMLVRLDWAPLFYGAYGGIGCILFGLYERRLGRELR